MSATATRPTRRRSGTAEWHMSREAVSLSVPEVCGWSNSECHEFLVSVRFGSRETVSCPHCGTIGKHYWRGHDSRWKCMGCGSTFSVTSGTVFARHKRPLKDIVVTALMWVNSASGQPALEMKRHLDCTYNTAFVWQHKLREALVRGYNVGLLSGDIEMDGAHQSGRRANEKRGRPQGARPITADTPLAELNSTMLTQTGRDTGRKKSRGEQRDPQFGRAMPPNRRILLSMRKRSGLRGKGACGTRVAIGLVETAPVAEAALHNFVAIPESYLNTDTSPAYSAIGKQFLQHRTVEHAKTLIGPAGENNNQAEEFNWRYDRAEKGVYLNIEPKYILDYAVETAFRSDTRRLPNGQQLKLLLNVALSVGESHFWKGFTRGQHRTVELIHPAPIPAPSSGPPKGRAVPPRLPR